MMKKMMKDMPPEMLEKIKERHPELAKHLEENSE
jgi:hypothetical protein